MSDAYINTSIEILGKFYPVRCSADELPDLNEAARYLDGKMREIQESGKVVNLERIAIIAALNIAHEFLAEGRQKNTVMSKINRKLALLQDRIDDALRDPIQTELSYGAELTGG